MVMGDTVLFEEEVNNPAMNSFLIHVDLCLLWRRLRRADPR
jgi:hypothetical protein